MAFKINVDKYGYSASPEKVSGNYAAELAKKLFKDEAEARASAVSGVGADLSREVLDRKNAVQAVTADLTAEGEVRAAQDTAIRADLKSATESLSADLANEIKTRAAQDAELRTALNTEISEAVKTLRNEVDGKADKSTMEEELEHKADISYVDNQYDDLHEYFTGLNSATSESFNDKFVEIEAKFEQALTKYDVEEDTPDEFLDEGIYCVWGNVSEGLMSPGEVKRRVLVRYIVYHGESYGTTPLDETHYHAIHQIRLKNENISFRSNTEEMEEVPEGFVPMLHRVWSEWSDYLTSENAYTKDEVNLHVENLIRACSHLQEQINEKPSYDDLWSKTETIHARINKKADIPTISSTNATKFTFDFSEKYNSELRVQNASAVSIKFTDDEYYEDYISGLSFDSGETPTMFDYTDSGIINWVGTDCTTSNGLSIFRPSANTHYDIVFYFNGVQFIGLVNGFVPATGNEVSE